MDMDFWAVPAFLGVFTPFLAVLALVLALRVIRWIGHEFRVGWWRAFDDERYHAEEQARQTRQKQREAETERRIAELEQRLEDRRMVRRS